MKLSNAQDALMSQLGSNLVRLRKSSFGSRWILLADGRYSGTVRPATALRLAALGLIEPGQLVGPDRGDPQQARDWNLSAKGREYLKARDA